MLDKPALRKKYAFKDPISEQINNTIIGKLSEYIAQKKPNLVGIYIPLKGEIDLSLLMLKHTEVKFAAPRIDDDKMSFARYSLTSSIEKSKAYKSISQPKATGEIFPDLILIPAIAFDLRGYRLGRGKGHYDKYFSHHDATKIGVIQNEKIIEYIPEEMHDKKMDVIISQDLVIDLCK